MAPLDDELENSNGVATLDSPNGERIPPHLLPDDGPEMFDDSERVFAELASLDLISDDGEPKESSWHRKSMNLLIDQIDHLYFHVRGRTDYYVGGNMFIYFSPEQSRTKDFRGPDFFFVKRTKRLPIRDKWVVWEEKLRTPDVVIELASESTRREDHNAKFEIYRDTLRVSNYFIYDRDGYKLEGWKLVDDEYVPIAPGPNGRLYSDQLGLWLGSWDGDTVEPSTWPRFYHEDGTVVLVRAEAAEQRADVAEKRAEAAEAEIARLKDMLAKSGVKS